MSETLKPRPFCGSASLRLCVMGVVGALKA